jgi:hypothetical protein
MSDDEKLEAAFQALEIMYWQDCPEPRAYEFLDRFTKEQLTAWYDVAEAYLYEGHEEDPARGREDDRFELLESLLNTDIPDRRGDDQRPIPEEPR